MRLTRSASVLAALAVLSVPALSACGSDDQPSGTGDSSAATSEGGDTGDTGDEPAEPTSVSFADCTAITADEMAAVLGTGTGIAEVPPASTSCSYTLDDPSQPSTTLEQFTTADFADGFEGAVANIATTAVGPIEGAVVSSADVGDGAEIAIGPSPLGGESLQSIGLVLIGDTIVRATTLQAVDLDEAAMTELTTAILELVASKA